MGGGAGWNAAYAKGVGREHAPHVFAHVYQIRRGKSAGWLRDGKGRGGYEDRHDKGGGGGDGSREGGGQD